MIRIKVRRTTPTTHTTRFPYELLNSVYKPAMCKPGRIGFFYEQDDVANPRKTVLQVCVTPHLASLFWPSATKQRQGKHNHQTSIHHHDNEDDDQVALDCRFLVPRTASAR